MGDVLLAIVSCCRVVYSLGFLGGLTCILTAWLGLVVLLFCYAVSIDAFVFFVWTRFFPPKALWAKRGCWAIVTGGGRGIGRAFALELASRGLHVCIIGRSEAPLRATEKDIKAKGVKCHVVVHCFAPVKSMVTVAQELGEKLAAVLPLTTVLVNNVGTVGLESNFGMPYLDVHHPKLETAGPVPSTSVLPRETVHSLTVTEEVIASNVCGMILMSSLVIPYMKQNAANVGEALVINIGSITGLRGIKKFSTYAATKSFVNTFTSGLEQEMQDNHGGSLLEGQTKGGPRILVQTVTPAITTTNLVPKGLIASPLFRWLMVSPEEVAYGALRVAGVQSTTDGTLSHCLQNNALRVLNAHVPRIVMDVCFHWVTRLVVDATRKSTSAKEC